jgi:protein-L-isoaspartate(D-aspartate) O-methyltransferase
MVSRTAPGFRTQLLATRKQTISRLQAYRGFIIDVRAPSDQLIAHWGNPMNPRWPLTCPSEVSRGNICFRLLVYLCFVLADAGFLLAQRDNEDYHKQCEEMVRTQIATVRWSGSQAVQDSRVLDSMRKTPRHRFVPDALVAYAYDDRPLPIGYGQTISQPYIVAKMTELLEPKREHRVLEIGTGSGYQAAVLSPLVAEVYSIEIIEPLGTAARRRLDTLGYKNVEVRVGDGYFGWPEKGPFDGIIVTAAANHIPPPLVEQLKPGGRMVIPVGNPFQTQTLMLVTKGSKGPHDLQVRNLMPVAFVPLVGGPKAN